MNTAVQSESNKPVPERQQFLIVPIFFKQQIEAVIKANAPDYTLGFLYGDEKDNFKIIKKIWPLAKVKGSGKQLKIDKDDFEKALELIQGSSMKLLGCFYTSSSGGVSKALLQEVNGTSFSFVELTNTNDACSWISSHQSADAQAVSEKVIL